MYFRRVQSFVSDNYNQHCHQSLHTILSSPLNYHRLLVWVLLLVLFIIINWRFNRLIFDGKLIASGQDTTHLCFQWQSIENQQSRKQECLQEKNIISSIWTHNGTGIMKYIQWIVTRKIENIRLIQMNNDCEIIRKDEFSSNSTSDRFIQIYLISLTANFESKSKCSNVFLRVINFGRRKIKHIYFKRRSIKATVVYQYLDTIQYNHSFNFHWNNSFDQMIEKAKLTTQQIRNSFTIIQKLDSTIIDSENMIHSNLIDCERELINFISLLGLNTSMQTLKHIIQYDSSQFTQDATWWDQSETIESILPTSLEMDPLNLTYSNDFYHLHGNRSLMEYVRDNRQCFNAGIFPQMKSEKMNNYSPINNSKQCEKKQFDCAFGDLYSFSDREQLYQSWKSDTYFNQKPIKCAFAIHSLMDQIRDRYGRNHTCQTVIFTSIINCYDPLPVIRGKVPSGSCFIALLDTKTINGLKTYYSANSQARNPEIQWDLIDLGLNCSIFRIPVKIIETLKIVGHRMFPMAKWIVWLDGKGHITDIKDILIQTQAPFISSHHHDVMRGPDSEFSDTIAWMKFRYMNNIESLSKTLEEIELQQTQYTQDGFYFRSAKLGLKMFDIAGVIYRNNHPCIYRYLCGWHNEINYFSFRGQLSVLYPAVRLNLTDYLNFIPSKFFHTSNHASVC